LRCFVRAALEHDLVVCVVCDDPDFLVVHAAAFEGYAHVHDAGRDEVGERLDALLEDAVAHVLEDGEELVRESVVYGA
jgi:putative intracellular protease/amidase